MNYQRIHDAHHVIPRCLGGTDDKSNLVELTAREHFIVHKLLKDYAIKYKKKHKCFGNIN